MIRSKSWVPSLSAVALFAAIAACDRPETAARPPAVTIRDSADIEIVENHAPQWDEGNAWTVARTPEIVIGGYRDVIDADSSHLVATGSPEPAFSLRSAVGGRGNPISVYITNTDRYEVHQYSSTGVLRRILRRTADPIPITAKDVQEWKDGHARSLDWGAWD